MPDPSTTRLALYKSKSDGSEDVNYPQDIGQNWDKVDTAVGALACTASTRPSTPYNGRLIRETDTGRIWVSNGSAPASGSWTEIATPGTAQTFTQGMTITGLSALSTQTNTTDAAFRTRITGDTQSRYIVNAAGAITWGPGGSTAGDTTLYRSAANTLKTDDAFVAALGISALAGVGTVLFARKTADTTRASTTTITSDPHLSVSMEANATYTMSGYIVFNNTAGGPINAPGDLAIQTTTPGDALGSWGAYAPSTSVAAEPASLREIDQPHNTARTYGTGASSVPSMMILSGIVRTVSAGTLAMGWAQVSSNADGTVLYTDSWIKLERVA